MKTCGIVAEYNPFHNGHAYQIRRIREDLKADYIVVVMSGDFVQRGEPAIMEKHDRAEMALLSGADLVIELPYSLAVSTAESFARGSVFLLSSLGVVDYICFGAEDRPDLLFPAANVLSQEPPLYKKLLAQKLSENLSYAAARAEACSSYLQRSEQTSSDIAGQMTTDNKRLQQASYSIAGQMQTDDKRLRQTAQPHCGSLSPFAHGRDQQSSPDHSLSSSPAFAFIKSDDKPGIQDILKKPNNILAVEYLKALSFLKSSMHPYVILREGQDYLESDLPPEGYASANAIRKALRQKDTSDPAFEKSLPHASVKMIKNSLQENAVVFPEDLDGLVTYLLQTGSPGEFHTLSGTNTDSELISRIFRLRNEYRTFEQFAGLVSSRTLPRSHVRRMLLHMLMDPGEAKLSDLSARILGFRQGSEELLTAIGQKSSIPLISKLPDAIRLEEKGRADILLASARSSNVYATLVQQKSGTPFIQEYQKPIRRIP